MSETEEDRRGRRPCLSLALYTYLLMFQWLRVGTLSSPQDRVGALPRRAAAVR